MHSNLCPRLRLEAEILQEQLLQLFLAHPHVGITVTDQQTRRVLLQLPQVGSFQLSAACRRTLSQCSRVPPAALCSVLAIFAEVLPGATGEVCY